MTERSITRPYTLRKQERVCSKNTIDKLFKGGSSRSITAYPLRVVYLEADENSKEKCQVMVSVPKKCFKRAVRRNRVKRQVREAYRLNKHIVADTMAEREGKCLTMAFIWLDDNLHGTDEIKAKVRNLLGRISERLCKQLSNGSQEP